MVSPVVGSVWSRLSKPKNGKKKWRRVLGGASSLVSIGGIGWSLIFGVSSLPFFGAG